MQKEFIKTLSNLAQLDIDAVHAYEQAIERIDYAPIRDELRKFQMDHQRHVRELSALIKQHGEKPPEFSRDFKGFLIEGFTALRSITGTEGALKAMQSNEETTTKHYSEALDSDLPLEARALVERNYGDERRHLNYVKGALASRRWEQASTAHAAH